MLTRITYIFLLSGAVVTLGFMAHAGNLSEPSWWIFLPLFAAWALFPYAAVGVEVRRHPANHRSRMALCGAAALLSGSSITLLYSAFVIHLDPQSGLVLVFLPLWQLIGLVPFLWLSRHLSRQPSDE